MSATEQITEMLMAGYGVDFASEKGLARGWTRAVTEQGWDLDRSGRIQIRLRSLRPSPQVATPAPGTGGTFADWSSQEPPALGAERGSTRPAPVDVLAAGLAHADPKVRAAARAVEKAVDVLCTLLAQAGRHG